MFRPWYYYLLSQQPLLLLELLQQTEEVRTKLSGVTFYLFYSSIINLFSSIIALVAASTPSLLELSYLPWCSLTL
jgi:hypothetical protein